MKSSSLSIPRSVEKKFRCILHPADKKCLNGQQILDKGQGADLVDKELVPEIIKAVRNGYAIGAKKAKKSTKLQPLVLHRSLGPEIRLS